MKAGLDLGTVSAFAVYNKKVEGLSSYVDTNNEPTALSKRKKKNKKKNRKNKLLQNGGVVAAPIPIIQPTISKKKKNKKKQRKLRLAQELAEQQQTNKSSSGAAAAELQPQQNGGGLKRKKAVQPVVTAVVVPSPKISKKKPEKPEKAKAAPAASVPLSNGATRTKFLSITSLITSAPIGDSSVYGQDLFSWLIYPETLENFFDKAWEKSPFHVRRPDAGHYYQWLLSSEKLDEVVRKNVLKFGKNLDVTSYTGGVRETHNPPEGGRALPPVLWDYYANGCSVRFLNPQTYIKPIWRLNAALQEYLGTFVGSNVYLTPPESQGFAPHYDDIEAFILQVEGRKHWKLYSPRSPDEELPRFSSPNFNEDTDNLGPPILDVILEEGDMLYFPRGTIHQARAVQGAHSLHITISAYQQNTRADLIKQYLPMALEETVRSDVFLRRGLPLDYLSYMGIAHADTTDPTKLALRAKFTKLMRTCTRKLLERSFDLAADEMGKKFIWDSLPPYLTQPEKEHTVLEDGEFLAEGGRVRNRSELTPDSRIKLVRKSCLRVVLEGDGDVGLRVYYNTENSLEYHAEEMQFLEVGRVAGPGLQTLIDNYPQFTSIHSLPITDEAIKFGLAGALWEKGLVITEEPLEPMALEEDDHDDEETLDDSEFDEDDEMNDEDLEFIDDEELSCDEDGDSLREAGESGDDDELDEDVNCGVRACRRKHNSSSSHWLDDEAEESDRMESGCSGSDEEIVPQLVQITTATAEKKKKKKKKNI